MVDVLRRRNMIEALESNADALTRLDVMESALSEVSARVEARELGRRTFNNTALDAAWTHPYNTLIHCKHSQPLPILSFHGDGHRVYMT